MTSARTLAHYWEISRYESELRDSSSETWTHIDEVGERFNGLVFTLDEYLRVENLYVDAALRFALDADATQFEVVAVGTNRGNGPETGQHLVRSDLGAVVRGNLRGDFGCVVVSVGGTYELVFGYDLYMYVAALTHCRQAVAEVTRSGLVIQPGVTPPHWTD